MLLLVGMKTFPPGYFQSGFLLPKIGISCLRGISVAKYHIILIESKKSEFEQSFCFINSEAEKYLPQEKESASFTFTRDSIKGQIKLQTVKR